MFEFVLSVFLALLVAVIVHWIVFVARLPKNLPPGPMVLPLVGSIWVFFGRDYCKVFTELRDKYGDSTTIFTGCSLSGTMVIMLGWDAIAEISNNPDKAAVTADRPLLLTELRGVKEGIVWAQYEVARERRRLLARSFKEFGLSTNKTTPLIHEEAVRLVNAIESENGKPFNPIMLLTEAVSSCVLLSSYGHRFDTNDKTCAKLFECGRSFFDANLMQHAMLPYLKFLKPFIPDKTAADERVMEATMARLLQEEITTRGSIDGQSSDILDVYLSTTFKGELDDGFVRSMVDVFLASMDTVSKAISWALFYLAHMPDELERLNKEIESVIPSTVFPLISNRTQLPRVLAFLEESARYSCLTPTNFFRRCSAPVALGSYVIPENSSLLIVSFPSHFDEKFWLDPANFRVERWLDPVDGHFIPSKSHFLPFSVGRRSCPGEQVARNLTFLFVSTLIQRFKWQLAEHVPFDTYRYRLTRVPMPYRLIFTSRN